MWIFKIYLFVIFNSTFKKNQDFQFGLQSRTHLCSIYKRHIKWFRKAESEGVSKDIQGETETRRKQGLLCATLFSGFFSPSW